jgi:hypothetical protein
LPYGVSDDQYKDFLRHPRNMTFTVAATDIVEAGKPELLELFKPAKLKSGFELEPPLTIDEDPKAAETLRPGENPWDQIIMKTYLLEGTITYRELESGQFEAAVFIPGE